MILKKVEALCAEKKISIARLEKECGFGNATIRGWDKSMPNLKSLMKVADYFGVSIEYFLDDSDSTA